MPLPATTPLRGLPCAVLDVEATGLDHATAHVLEIAVVHVELGATALPVVAFTSRVRPPCSIPPRITELTGLTDADVASAPTWAEIADQVLAACEGRVVAAFNAPADYQWVNAEFRRLTGSPLPWPGSELPWPWLDLLVLRKAAVSRGPPGRLGQLATDRGILLEAHGATGDAVAAALLLDGLMRGAYHASQGFTSAGGARAAADRRRRSRWGDDDGCDEDDYTPDPVTTLGPFLRWQRAAALEQEREYAHYRHREGDRTPPRSDWHAIEGVTPITWESPVPTRACDDCGASITLRIARDGQIDLLDPDLTPHVCPAPLGHPIGCECDGCNAPF